jgi:hypothetical protein
MRPRQTGGTILIARMNRFRLALILAGAGFAAKGGAVIVYRLLHPPVLLRVLTTYDPLGVRFADAALPLFFDLRGIAPPAAAPAVYEVLLVFAFAAQCLILGLAISKVRGVYRRHLGSPPDAPPVVG